MKTQFGSCFGLGGGFLAGVGRTRPCVGVRLTVGAGFGWSLSVTFGAGEGVGWLLGETLGTALGETLGAAVGVVVGIIVGVATIAFASGFLDSIELELFSQITPPTPPVRNTNAAIGISQKGFLFLSESGSVASENVKDLVGASVLFNNWAL